MDLAQQKKSDYVIHVYAPPAADARAGPIRAKKLGLKRIATIADDFTMATRERRASSTCSRTTGARSCRSSGAAECRRLRSYVGQIKPNIDGVYAGFAAATPCASCARTRSTPQQARLRNPTLVDEGILKNMATRRSECIRRAGTPSTRHARQQALRAGDPAE